MARQPTFDRGHVVEKAMDVFWRTGYQAASIKVLGDAMGLQPGSIYAAFGSKEALFREALETYVGRIRVQAVASRLSPRRHLERWFAAHIDGSLRDGRGCLLLNSAAELPQIDAESATAVRAALDALEDHFYDNVVAARAGSQYAGPSARATARLLVAALAGIAVMSRAGVDRATLKHVAQAALASVCEQ